MGWGRDAAGSAQLGWQMGRNSSPLYEGLDGLPKHDKTGQNRKIELRNIC